MGRSSSTKGRFREVKVSLAEVQLVMADELTVARGAATRSELIRRLILDAYTSMRKPVPMNPQRKTVSVLVKTQSGEFQAVIDTGSDHTLVPERYAKGFVFMETRPIWTFGAVTRLKLYKGKIEVIGKKISIESALLTTGEVGVLGLDALKHFEVLIRKGKATIKAI